MPLPLDELTERQLAVALELAQRKTQKEIARKLSVSPHTIKTHSSEIYSKLGCNRDVLIRSLDEVERWVSAKNSEYGSLSLKSVSGTWLSRFTFTSRDPLNEEEIGGVQFNIEALEEASSRGPFSIQGWSMYGASTGRVVYRHEIMCDLVGQSLVGVWTNTNSLNRGCFQLSVHSTERTMKGKHLGLSSANIVDVGEWFWLKISDEIVCEDKEIITLGEIEQIFDKWKSVGQPITEHDLLR